MPFEKETAIIGKERELQNIYAEIESNILSLKESIRLFTNSLEPGKQPDLDARDNTRQLIVTIKELMLPLEDILFLDAEFATLGRSALNPYRSADADIYFQDIRTSLTDPIRASMSNDFLTLLQKLNGLENPLRWGNKAELEQYLADGSAPLSLELMQQTVRDQLQGILNEIKPQRENHQTVLKSELIAISPHGIAPLQKSRKRKKYNHIKTLLRDSDENENRYDTLVEPASATEALSSSSTDVPNKRDFNRFLLLFTLGKERIPYCVRKHLKKLSKTDPNFVRKLEALAVALGHEDLSKGLESLSAGITGGTKVELIANMNIPKGKYGGIVETIITMCKNARGVYPDKPISKIIDEMLQKALELCRDKYKSSDGSFNETAFKANLNHVLNKKKGGRLPVNFKPSPPEGDTQKKQISWWQEKAEQIGGKLQDMVGLDTLFQPAIEWLKNRGGGGNQGNSDDDKKTKKKAKVEKAVRKAQAIVEPKRR